MMIWIFKSFQKPLQYQIFYMRISLLVLLVDDTGVDTEDDVEDDALA